MYGAIFNQFNMILQEKKISYDYIKNLSNLSFSFSFFSPPLFAYELGLFFPMEMHMISCFTKSFFFHAKIFYFDTPFICKMGCFRTAMFRKQY